MNCNSELKLLSWIISCGLVESLWFLSWSVALTHPSSSTWPSQWSSVSSFWTGSSCLGRVQLHKDITHLLHILLLLRIRCLLLLLLSILFEVISCHDPVDLSIVIQHTQSRHVSLLMEELLECIFLIEEGGLGCFHCSHSSLRCFLPLVSTSNSFLTP